MSKNISSSEIAAARRGFAPYAVGYARLLSDPEPLRVARAADETPERRYHPDHRLACA